jgi:hypothetical protein
MVVRAGAAAGVLIAAMLGGCAARRPAEPRPAPVPEAAAGTRQPESPLLPGIDYIDLEPGWRLRVVTPLLKGGGYQLHAPQARIEGLTVNVAGAEELEGYETSYYAVWPREQEGGAIEFTSAEETRKNVTSPVAEPRLRLFRLPAEAKHVRLIFLARLSPSDHDMAIAATTSREALDALTRAVKANRAGCADGPAGFCSWIPAGIAVVPELRRTGAGGQEWVPAR